MTDEFLDFDKMWDYSKPEETEVKFREHLSKTDINNDKSYYLQLMTQLARTQGLQQKFDEAHSTLNEVESQLSDELNLVEVRYLLERGRSFRSNNDKEKSIPLFKKAFEIANENGFDFFIIDAAHMLGIADIEEKQIEWNEIAINIAENSSSKRANNWLGSLYNNLGWTYNFQKDYLKALYLFEKAVVFREEQGNLDTFLIAKWCVARTYRYLERNDEALELQLKLLKERKNRDLGPNGYVEEELGELYLLKGEKKNPQITSN